MPLLTATGACLAYGHVPLLDHADFQLDKGERVALIGRNGSGKSSLLKALAGAGHLDDGEIWRQPALKLAYVPQEPPLNPESTVFEAVVDGMGDTSALLAEYHAVSHAMAEADADHEGLMARLQVLQTELDARGAWTYASQADRVIERFGLDPDAKVASLSGGQKKRLALAQALAIGPEVLLLDEPTNHLDLDAIAWLEEQLVSAGVTLLFITHDRRFLDRLATRIVELDRGKLASYPGSFTAYQERKEQELKDEALANARFDKLLKEEEVWIRKGVEARRTRAVFRVQRLDQLRSERAARREQQGRVDFNLDAGEKSGKVVAELTHVSKAFGEGETRKTVIRDFSCRILRGDKIGLIGPNGAGKTTLLKLILGQLAPDSGTVRLGTKMQVAYFDQFREALDPEAALTDVISPGSDTVEINGEKKHVIGYLGDFLFAPERARSPVKSLSGGERNRLLLARLFARPANVLVLDEPTNDLDIDTLELLENLLQDYPGTVFLVSHDRAFLDNVVTQVIAAEGNGVWREHVGGYDDWARWRVAQGARPSGFADASAATATSRKASSPTSVEKGAQPSVSASAPAAPAKPKPVKLSYKEQRELDTLPDRIAALESEQAALTQRLEDPNLYASAPQEANAFADRLSAIDEELLELLGRWEELEAKQKGA